MAKSNARAQSEQLFNLQIQGDKYARLLVEQKHRLRQLDDHWKKLHEELKELRQKRGEGDQRGGGANAVRARMADEQRELMKLENRLSACKTRESKMAALNVELKKRVDELRATRVISQGIFEKNQRKLKDIQRQMQDAFRQSTQIVAERDRILAQAYSLTANNMEEQDAFDEVYGSLAAIIKREKENAESYRKQILEQDPLDLSDDFVRGNMKFDEEQQLKRSLQQLDQTLQEDTQKIASINERLQEFETTFAALQEQMEVNDYHDLVTAYQKKEEENFAMFRYVQSINNEAEQLEEEKRHLEQEIQQITRNVKEGNSNGRKRMIDSLVETRQKILKENSELERLRAAASREFQPIARAVDRLYNSLGCNDVMPPVVTNNNSNSVDAASKRSRKQSEDQMAMMARINSMNDLLAAHGITEGNILQFLAIIEQRSNEIIEQFSRRLQHKNPAEAGRATLGANLEPSDPMRSIVAARSVLPDFTSAGGGAGGGPETSSGNSPMKSILGAAGAADSSSTIVEDDLGPSASDDDEEDRPMSIADLQKRAAQTVGALQINPKLEPIRMRTLPGRKARK